MQSVGYSTSFAGIIDPGDLPCSPPTLVLCLLTSSFFFTSSSSFSLLLPPRQHKTPPYWLVVSKIGLVLLTCSTPFPSSAPLPYASHLDLLHKGIQVFTGHITTWRRQKKEQPDVAISRGLAGSFIRGVWTPPCPLCLFLKCPTPYNCCLVMLFLLQLQVLMRWHCVISCVTVGGAFYLPWNIFAAKL